MTTGEMSPIAAPAIREVATCHGEGREGREFRARRFLRQPTFPNPLPQGLSEASQPFGQFLVETAAECGVFGRQAAQPRQAMLPPIPGFVGRQGNQAPPLVQQCPIRLVIGQGNPGAPLGVMGACLGHAIQKAAIAQHFLPQQGSSAEQGVFPSGNSIPRVDEGGGRNGIDGP